MFPSFLAFYVAKYYRMCVFNKIQHGSKPLYSVERANPPSRYRAPMTVPGPVRALGSFCFTDDRFMLSVSSCIVPLGISSNSPLA